MNFSDRYYFHKNTVYRIAYSYMGNPADAEDIMQNAFLALFQRKWEFDSMEDEKRWLIRVTINLCLNEKKSFWHRKRASLEELPDYCTNETGREVQDAIEHLKPKNKACIHLHYIEGYSVSEIGEILQISESAVKMRLKRGRQQLKMELEH